MTKPLGLYIHIPFCKQKCAYCDFYSVCEKELEKPFAEALKREIKQWGGKCSRPIDTIYFGGGTPSLLAEYLPQIMQEIRSCFAVCENAEITMEMNPGDGAENILCLAKKAGINRLSIGVQSGNDNELSVLGRRHNADKAAETVKIARNLGFSNISLDLMLGLPNSSDETLQSSLEFVTALSPQHISAYILKVEENTPFGRMENLNLPDEDEIASQYLQMCDFLQAKGYCHYEISNFAKKGFESRHNTKYWLCEEYLGLGPAAHSFLDGKRFYYPKNLRAFITGNSPLPDGEGGSLEEQIMLKLRLKEGVDLSEYTNPNLHKKCNMLAKNGLININNNKISLTDKGMLLSNSIILEILEYLI